MPAFRVSTGLFVEHERGREGEERLVLGGREGRGRFWVEGGCCFFGGRGRGEGEGGVGVDLFVWGWG